MKKKRQVLKGHKRIKARFIPPMMQIGTIKETSYINDLIPHVIWMSLLIESVGLRRGIAVSLDLAKLAHGIHVSEKHVNFAICGNHQQLTEEERSDILRVLGASGELRMYQDALVPLLYLHPDCPMSYLGTPPDVPERSALVERLSAAIDAIFDRYAAPASVVQANVVMARATTGGLFIAEHIPLPDFEAMVRDPESESGRRAASFARTSCMQEFMPDEEQKYTEWPRAFWRRNYRLDSCCLLELEDE